MASRCSPSGSPSTPGRTPSGSPRTCLRRSAKPAWPSVTWAPLWSVAGLALSPDCASGWRRPRHTVTRSASRCTVSAASMRSGWTRWVRRWWSPMLVAARCTGRATATGSASQGQLWMGRRTCRALPRRWRARRSIQRRPDWCAPSPIGRPSRHRWCRCTYAGPTPNHRRWPDDCHVRHADAQRRGPVRGAGKAAVRRRRSVAGAGVHGGVGGQAHPLCGRPCRRQARGLRRDLPARPKAALRVRDSHHRGGPRLPGPGHRQADDDGAARIRFGWHGLSRGAHRQRSSDRAVREPGLRQRRPAASGLPSQRLRRIHHETGSAMTIVLAIESSCDETGVGIARLDDAGTVTLLADEVASSVDEHARFGGVVPEIASRAHLEALGPTMRRALGTADVDKPDVVAATIGPGLAGALLVGVAAAKAYSAAWQVPFYAVNHLGGHLAADVYDHGPLPESIGLLVSGGHTNLLHVRSLGEPIVELGSTVDDAAGEAYDKVARLLGLGYPGGKVLDDLAREGDRDAIVFPRGMTGPRDDPYAFSFSGLKTAVARYVESHPDASQADVAAGFQEAVADVLTRKAVRAAKELNVSTLLIAGGVAANSRLRELAEERCAANGLTLRIPRPRLCTDNGAMIASFAAHLIAAGASPSPLDVASDPGLPIVKGQVA